MWILKNNNNNKYYLIKSKFWFKKKKKKDLQIVKARPPQGSNKQRESIIRPMVGARPQRWWVTRATAIHTKDGRPTASKSPHQRVYNVRFRLQVNTCCWGRLPVTFLILDWDREEPKHVLLLLLLDLFGETF